MTGIETFAVDAGGLVLSRKQGQTISIGDNVLIQVVETRSDKVRLRIIAPKSVSVMRTEILEREAERCKPQ